VFCHGFTTFIGLFTTEDVFVNIFVDFSFVLCLKLVCTVRSPVIDPVWPRGFQEV